MHSILAFLFSFFIFFFFFSRFFFFTTSFTSALAFVSLSLSLSSSILVQPGQGGLISPLNLEKEVWLLHPIKRSVNKE